MSLSQPFVRLLAGLCLAACFSPARADYIFYADGDSFTADNPSLPIETFESIPMGSLPYINTFSPANATTLDPPASLLPGFSIASGAFANPPRQIVITGVGTVPGATQAIGTAFPGNPLEITFTTPVTAAGLVILSTPAPGLTSDATVDIQASTSSGGPIQTTVNVSGVNTFFGIKSATDPIYRLTLTSRNFNSVLLIDNLSFGLPITGPVLVQKFTTQLAFQAANPALPVETFDAANVVAGFIIIPGDLNADSAAGHFPPESLLGGFTARSVGSGGNHLVITASGTFPGANNTPRLGEAAFGNALDLTFDLSPTAVAFDLYCSPGPGFVIPGTFLIRIYNADALLDSTTFAVSQEGSFFGISSAGPITRISISNLSNPAAVFIDNLTFGTPSPVPEPSALAIMSLGSLCLRRRRRAGPDCIQTLRVKRIPAILTSSPALDKTP